jgi:hypothetical protein
VKKRSDRLDDTLIPKGYHGATEADYAVDVLLDGNDGTTVVMIPITTMPPPK